MLKLALNVAHSMGTDPITLTLVLFLAGICAFVMRAMMRQSVGVFAISPILFGAGLLAAYFAMRFGFTEVLDVHIGEFGDWELDWKEAAQILPNIVLSSMAGIVAGALAIIGVMHEVQRHI